MTGTARGTGSDTEDTVRGREVGLAGCEWVKCDNLKQWVVGGTLSTPGGGSVWGGVSDSGGVVVRTILRTTDGTGVRTRRVVGPETRGP